MKSVLISIQPKWCELIASGKKTVEIRKTKPKTYTPFKVYIYCTKSRKSYESFAVSGKPYECGGKVIGEFVCDAIEHYTSNCTVFESVLLPSPSELEEMCLTLDEFNTYGTRGKLLYGWHISDLVIYDKPKELSEFWSVDKCLYASEDGCTYKFHCFRSGQTKRCGSTLTRPPQSWCYVETQ